MLTVRPSNLQNFGQRLREKDILTKVRSKVWQIVGVTSGGFRVHRSQPAARNEELNPMNEIVPRAVRLLRADGFEIV